MIGALAALPFLLVGGFLFDLMGRFKTIVLLFSLTGISIIAIPLVAPSVAAYYFCRTLMQCALSPVLMNPFVNDYVVVRQRGAGMALQSFGMTVGNILSIAVLLTLTKQMSIIGGFMLSGGLLFVAIAIFWGGKMIVEPTVNEDKEGKRRAKKSILGQIRSQLRQLWKACQADIPLKVGIFAVSVSRISVCMSQVNFLTWMTLLNEENDLGIQNIPAIWQKQILISQCCALAFVVIAGKLGDKMSYKITIPAVLIFQMLVGVLYTTVTDPRSWWAYFMSVFFMGSGMMIIIIMQGYVAKRTPKMIRGITNAVMGMFGSLGGMPYLAIAGYTTKKFDAASWTWWTLVLLDGLMLIFVSVMIF